MYSRPGDVAFDGLMVQVVDFKNEGLLLKQVTP